MKLKKLLSLTLALMLIMSVFGTVTATVSTAEESYVSSIELDESGDTVTVTLRGGADLNGKTLILASYNEDKLVSVERKKGITGTTLKFDAPTAKYTKIKAFVWNDALQPFGVPASINVGAGINKTQKEFKLWYNAAAPKSKAEMGTNDLYLNYSGTQNPTGVRIAGEDYRDCPWNAQEDDGWQCWSLPLGNGFMGVNVFGRTETERLQITEPSLFNPYSEGLGNFSETYIDFGHTNVTNYERNLVLNDAIANVKYTSGGVNYTREIFTSYPDKVMAIKLTASGSGNLNFTLRPTIPHLDQYSLSVRNTQKGKSNCSVVASGDTITLSGKMNYYGIEFEGQYKVIPAGGSMTNPGGDKIQVTGANEAVILVTIGTNYKLESSIFVGGNGQNKLSNASVFPKPHDKVTKMLADASAKSYNELKTNHLADYKGYFERVNFDVGGAVPSIPTNALVSGYKKTNSDAYNKYLDELFFQYGRYLLIASSREGSLPANLQGIWNRYEQAPWSGGYWHNVNIQMNYWASFPTNLTDMFKPYAAYNAATRKASQDDADFYIGKVNPSAKTANGTNGWSIGTGCYPFYIQGVNYPTHSGPGTTGFTAQMFWDYYDFTRDPAVLSQTSYPALSGASLFYTKAVVPISDKLLIEHSFSPEQYRNGSEYESIGCAFDQQMIYESYTDTLKAAEALGNTTDPILNTINAQINKLDPVIVGYSGQVKEFREEKYYGEIGERTHRHASQLVGLYPGTAINSATPAWLDASRVTLDGRGPQTAYSWPIVYQQLLWARIRDGKRAYDEYQRLFTEITLPNLWTGKAGAPFQIDANFGGTAAVAEMLLQSQDGYIEPMAAIPDAWGTGHYSGLLARGNFEVSAEWANGQAQSFEIKSNKGGECSVKFYNVENADVRTAKGASVTVKSSSKDMITFETEEGETYVFTDIPAYTKVANPGSFSASASSDFTKVSMSWSAASGAVSYNIYRAVESAPDYEFIKNVTGTSTTYDVPAIDVCRQATYRITAVAANGRESSGLAKTVVMQGAPKPETAASTLLAVNKLQILYSAVDGASLYNIYKKSGNRYDRVQSTKFEAAIITGSNVAGDYFVTAVTEFGESEMVPAPLKSSGTYADKSELISAMTAVSDSDFSLLLESIIERIDALVVSGRAVLRDLGASQTAVDDAAGALWDILDSFVLRSAVGVFLDAANTELQINISYLKNATSFNIYEKKSGNYVKIAESKFESAVIKSASKTGEYGVAAVIGEWVGNIIPVEIKFAPNFDNIFLNKPVSGDLTIIGGYPYEALVDGDFTTTRFSTWEERKPLTITLDLQGIYALDKLSIYEFLPHEMDASRSGETTIDVRVGSSWVNVIDKVPLLNPATNKFTTFDMDGVECSQVRLTFVNTVAASQYVISLYEITCSLTPEQPFWKPVVDKAGLVEALTASLALDPAKLSGALAEEFEALVFAGRTLLGDYAASKADVDAAAADITEFLAAHS